jgi:hypothetical protein
MLHFRPAERALRLCTDCTNLSTEAPVEERPDGHGDREPADEVLNQRGSTVSGLWKRPAPSVEPIDGGIFPRGPRAAERVVAGLQSGHRDERSGVGLGGRARRLAEGVGVGSGTHPIGACDTAPSPLNASLKQSQ